MSETPSGSASGSAPPKAIGSLAKKQGSVTRQGTQKLKFTPTLPARRTKEEVKAEPATSTLPEPSTADARGRGRGRGGTDPGRGRGRGRGAPPPVEMTASGPFALGPALAGSQARRSSRRTDLAAAPPPLPATSATPGENLTRTAAPNLKGSDIKGKAVVKEGEEAYSDPEDGVEIIDMNKIREMDWMAPESLVEEKKPEKLKKKDSQVTDAKNELVDFSESENEVLEDLIEDFALPNELDADSTLREDRLYFFQFPSPFPKFINPSTEPPPLRIIDPTTGPEPVQAESPTKKVSFAPDTKLSLTPASSRPSTVPPEHTKEEPVDGIIGQLEVYKSGAVKIRLANGILLDVNAATQPSFLQQAVHLDMSNKRLTVLGEVDKQFVVSPDIESFLEGLDKADKSLPVFQGEDDLIKMDTT